MSGSRGSGVVGISVFMLRIGNAFAGKYFFFYRSYAVLSDGSVSYGDIKSFTFER